MDSFEPPQDLVAEAAVLGSILLDNDSVATVATTLKAEDFYKEGHRKIWACVQELYEAGEPIDLVTLTDKLRIKGELEGAGNIPYLVGLADGVPTAAYVDSYARIVKEKSALRELRALGQKTTQLANDGKLEPGKIAEQLSQEIYRLSRVEERQSEEEDRIFDMALKYSDGSAFVPTGYLLLDEKIAGFPRGDITYIGARNSHGKALALDTPIITPQGWSSMGDLEVGGEVFDERGWPCRIVAATDVMGDRPCYKVTFSDGSEIIADAQHQWAVRKREALGILTTEQIRAGILEDQGKVTIHPYSVHTSEALRLPEIDLPIHPYLLGAWLGDGSSSGANITNPDVEIRQRIESLGYHTKDRASNSSGCPVYSLTDGDRTKVRHPDNVQGILRRMGVLNNKHIPVEYMMASEGQRTELFKGLMDTDGYCDTRGTCQFCSVNFDFANQVWELARGLGFKASLITGDATIGGRFIGKKYLVTFAPRMAHKVFHLPRKAVRVRQSGRRDRTLWHYITSVEPIPSVPVRCIEVDSPSHLFLAGKTLIPTHNSSLLYGCAEPMVDFFRREQEEDGEEPTAWMYSISPDQHPAQIWALEASRRSGIPMSTLQQRNTRGEYSCPDDAKTAWTTALIDVRQNYTRKVRIRRGSINPAQLRTEVLGALRNGAKVITLDTIQRVASGGDRGLDDIKSTSAFLKDVAADFNVPVVVLSQIKREVDDRDMEKGDGRRPHSNDVADAPTVIGNDAATMLFLYQEARYVPTTADVVPLSINVAKNKSGPAGGWGLNSISLAFQRSYAHLIDPLHVKRVEYGRGVVDLGPTRR